MLLIDLDRCEKLRTASDSCMYRSDGIEPDKVDFFQLGWLIADTLDDYGVNQYVTIKISYCRKKL
jgi:hypothetical protein